MVPWSAVSAFGFFSVLFFPFTYATTDVMIQRAANPAIPPAMKTGSHFVCSGGHRNIFLRLEKIKICSPIKLIMYADHRYATRYSRHSHLPLVLLTTCKVVCIAAVTDTKTLHYVAACYLTSKLYCPSVFLVTFVWIFASTVTGSISLAQHLSIGTTREWMSLNEFHGKCRSNFRSVIYLF